MRKLIIIFFTALCVGRGTLLAQTNKKLLQPIEFTMLKGTVSMILQNNLTPDNMIALRVTDRSINMQSGGIFEVRKLGDFFIINGKRYNNLNNGLKDYFKDHLERMFNNINSYTNILWPSFVEEGGLRFFIDVIQTFINDKYSNDS